jgi:TolB protein
MALMAFAGCVDDQPMAPRTATPIVASASVMAAIGMDTRITTDPADQQWVAVSGDRIVWRDSRNGAHDIYLFDLATSTETRLTTGAIAHRERPAISGTTVAWEDYRNGNADIYLYDLLTGEERQLTTHGAFQGSPAISGNRVVWDDERWGGFQIYLYDLSTSTESRISPNAGQQVHAAISGDKVVWEDWRNGNADIYLYDLTTNTETSITTNSALQLYPAISGDRIVWADYRNGNWDIYLYDLSTHTERRLTTNSASQEFPSISGDRVVWQDSRDGAPVIYMHDLSTDVQSRLSTTASVQIGPAISGDRIVWEDLRNGNWDVYLHVLPPAGPITPSFGFDLSGLPAKTYADADFSVAAYASTNSGGTVSFATGSGSAGCSVTTAGMVTITGAATGTTYCILTATLAPDGTYAGAGPIAQQFNIAKAAGSVSINNLPTSATADDSFTPTYTKLGDGVASVISTTTSVCTVSGGVVNFLAAGHCTLQAQVTEGTNHLAVTGSEQGVPVSPAAPVFSSSCTYTINAKNGKRTVTVTWTNASPGVTLVEVVDGKSVNKQMAPTASGSWSTSVKADPTYGIWGGTSRKDTGTWLVTAGSACTAG